MSLNPPIPGLRSIRYDARSAAKVQITVQPGDTMQVSDDVAEQLVAASAQFKTATPEEAAAVVPAPAPKVKKKTASKDA
jgi:hypothetical protein